MKEQFFGTLAAALQAMDADVSARIRPRGPHHIRVEEAAPIGDETEYTSANVEFYPNETLVSSLTQILPADQNGVPAMTASQSTNLVPRSVSSVAQSTSASDIAASSQASSFSPITQSDLVSSLLNAGEQLAPQAESAVQSTTDLVSSVSPGVANTISQKFAALTPGQKVAAGIGIYIGGKAALQFIPLKYLALGAGLYVWNQVQKQKAVASSANAATSTPVAGLG